MDRTELQHLMAKLRGSVSVRERVRVVDTIEIEFGKYIDVLAPLTLYPKNLNESAIIGEWIIEEVIKRACILLDVEKPNARVEIGCKDRIATSV